MFFTKKEALGTIAQAGTWFVAALSVFYLVREGFNQDADENLDPALTMVNGLDFELFGEDYEIMPEFELGLGK